MKKALRCWCVVFEVAVAFILWISTAAYEITPFRNNKKGAASITFDTIYPSQVMNVLPLFNNRNLKGTFFLATSSAWIDSHVFW